MSIALSVVIPTYQRCESLRQVLDACCRQTLAPDRYEVIVSIDGSTDTTGAMLAQLHTPYRLRWISKPHASAATARARGAAAARGTILLFLDDDVIPAPNLLAAHLAAHSGKSGRVGLGRVRQISRRSFSSWERYLCQRYQEHYRKLALPGYRPDFWDCLAGNLSLNRHLLVRYGSFDSTLDRHEDTELGYRLSRAGARFVYLPRAVGYHHFVRSVEGGLQDAFEEGMSATQLARRYGELAPHLIHARWERYPALGQTLMRRALAGPRRHARLAAMACVWAKWMNCVPLPFCLQKTCYRIAFHLYFWQGVRAAGGISAAWLGASTAARPIAVMCEPTSSSVATTRPSPTRWLVDDSCS